jgi:hypothetical protein
MSGNVSNPIWLYGINFGDNNTPISIFTSTQTYIACSLTSYMHSNESNAHRFCYCTYHSIIAAVAAIIETFMWQQQHQQHPCITAIQQASLQQQHNKQKSPIPTPTINVR